MQEEYLVWAVLERVVQRVATVADLDVLLWVVLQPSALELAVEVSMSVWWSLWFYCI